MSGIIAGFRRAAAQGKNRIWNQIALPLCCIGFIATASGATLYVDAAGGSPAAPYTDWATAATNIQDAVYAAVSGDTIIVTNGHYFLSAEITVTNDITIQSVNGPDATIVDGQGAVRCFKLNNVACVLSGLTVTNGYTSGNGGGIYCAGTTPVVTNCVITGNHAVENGGAIYSGTARNCHIIGNNARGGGGTSLTLVDGCTISNNRAPSGGGILGGTAYNCEISGNQAWYNYGGGVYLSRVNNCTIHGNSAVAEGGGTYATHLNNSIVWYNTAPLNRNIASGDITIDVRHTCSPDVTHGVDGNITNAPMLITASHVATNSPCRGAGSMAYATGTDIDGEPWQNPPSMGCDEFSGSAIGLLQVVNHCSTNLVSGRPYTFQTDFPGAPTLQVWDFGDGTSVTNALYPEHAWSAPGSYTVILTAYNDSFPSGVSATQTVEVADLYESAVHVAPSGNDANDGLSWASAKATIQAGIDAQVREGGLVWISNGVYAVTSEITVAKNVLIQGMNGPDATLIDGQGVARCFYLGNSPCLLNGLTITNGYIDSALTFLGCGGGIYCEGPMPIVTSCVISGNRAVGITAYGGGIYGGTALNCRITGNISGRFGGGVYYGTVENCVLVGNSAGAGGGIASSTATGCTILGNNAGLGGGMFDVAAYNCTITSNTASGTGGGVCWGSVNNCVINGNLALKYWGGGVAGATANNCIIMRNRAHWGGGISSWSSSDGWTYASEANNCTIVGNSADISGGGAYDSTANNCIVWYNSAEAFENIKFGTRVAVRYTCSPDVTHGIDGNITNAPMLTSASHVATNSPCRGAGDITYATGTDIDGEPWLDPPSMGCDEYHGPVTGALHTGISCNTNILTGVPYVFFGKTLGAPTMLVWDFADGTVVTNLPLVEHAWNVQGAYSVILTAYNDSYPDGVSATQTVSVAGLQDSAIHVAPDGDDANDGMSWATAKATIQTGIDAQTYIGGLVWISNGVYAVTSEITVAKKVIVQSLNGPEDTIVDGQGIVRGFNLGNTPCVISGLTITNGYGGLGGGISCSGSYPVVTNCIISGNIASQGGGICYGTVNNCIIRDNQAGGGGGLYYSEANNCFISDNQASAGGGGISWGSAINCTISGNSAGSKGGGVYYGLIKNCIVWENEAPSGSDINAAGIAYHTCSPGATHGENSNITNAPVFVDAANGDYRLLAASPCINAGTNGYVAGSVDLDGNPRVIGPAVDMGAYEYVYTDSGDEDGDGLPNGWEQEYFGGIAAAQPGTDADADTRDNLSEWIAGTDPLAAGSVFAVSNGMASAGFIVEWSPVPGRWYQVLWSPGLTNDFETLQDQLEYPQGSYTDLVHAVESAGFYAVEVRMK